MSISLVNLDILSYDLSIFLVINSRFLLLKSICLSENVLDIITLMRSSVGKLISISKKLSNLDFKSINLISRFLILIFEFKIILLLYCII